MAEESQGEAYEAVERVLTGAVSKVLSHFKGNPGRVTARNKLQQSAPTTKPNPRESHGQQSFSSDSDDFQQAPSRKKQKAIK